MDFATPSTTLSCYQLGPLRYSWHRLVHLALPNKRPTLYNLSFTFKERTIRRNRPRDFPSHEIHSLTPFHRHPPIESTPRTCKQALSAGAIQTPNHVPTLQFLTTSLVCASIKVAGLLRPATNLRVHAVFLVRLPHYEARYSTVQVLNTLGSHPPKNSTRQQRCTSPYTFPSYHSQLHLRLRSSYLRFPASNLTTPSDVSTLLRCVFRLNLSPRTQIVSMNHFKRIFEKKRSTVPWSHNAWLAPKNERTLQCEPSLLGTPHN